MTMNAVGEPLASPTGHKSPSTMGLKKKKSITRLFTTSLSRKSSRSRPPSPDGRHTPPTPDFLPLTPKTPIVPRIPTMNFEAFKDEVLFQEKSEPKLLMAVQNLGEASTNLGRLPVRDSDTRFNLQAKPTVGPRRAISSGHVHHRVAAHTVEAENIQQATKPTIHHAATHPIMLSETKTGRRKPSPFASLPKGKGASFTAPKFKGSPISPQQSRPLTAGREDISRPTGKRRPSDRAMGYDGATFPFPIYDDNVPQLPQRPWQADFSGEEVRSSVRSALTTGSSHMESNSTDRSSVFTKGTSVADSTVDLPSRPISKAGGGGMTVDDAIDMYAAGFADDDGTELGKSKDTSLSQKEARRSVRIAEAINDSIGGIITPTQRNTSESTSTYAIISGDAFRSSSALPPPILPPTSTRDQYGFFKASHHVSLKQHDAWWKEYCPSQERRKKKWTSYMRDYALPTYLPTRFPKRSEKSERFIRKGIPPAWRGQAWFYYAGGQAYLDKYPREYRTLVLRSDAELPPNDQEAIERDLHRTFPDNIHFKSDSADPLGAEPPLLASLRRVLRAFALHTPRVGYCQSLNFITGLLLLFLPEEKTFWMLHIITTVYLPGTHEISLEGANVDLWVLMVALKGTMPSIWSKVGAAGTPGDDLIGNARLPPISLCTTSWFMSLFIGTLPIETVLRVWDVLFYEGSRVLFRVALTIFKVGEQRIRDVGDSMELFQVVQGLPKDMLDVGSFMRAVCRRGGISSDWVDLRRWERREWYAKEKVKASYLRKEVHSDDYFEQEDGAQLKRKNSMWRRRDGRKRKISEPAPPLVKALNNQNEHGISILG